MPNRVTAARLRNEAGAGIRGERGDGRETTEGSIRGRRSGAVCEGGRPGGRGGLAAPRAAQPGPRRPADDPALWDHPQRPVRPFAAGSTPPTRFVGKEAYEVVYKSYRTGLVIEDNHSTCTQTTSDFGY